MNAPLAATADLAEPVCATSTARSAPPPVPGYLQQVYWWAYVHPNAVQVFEREWLVNTILFGHYPRLRDDALADLGRPLRGRTLQLACVYGNLTAMLQRQLTPSARLEVVDILPVQLANLRHKLPADERVTLTQADASSLAFDDASFDQVLLFFLLHEQPEHVRRATLAEAMRVVRPGGRVVIVDYHRPAPWHPMRPLMWLVFRRLEPYAIDLWRHDLLEYMPPGLKPAGLTRRRYFGGLYQKLVLTR